MYNRKLTIFTLSAFLVLSVFIAAFNYTVIKAKNSDECFACHEDKSHIGECDAIAKTIRMTDGL